MVGALQRIRVIDFGQYLAGPLLALVLADNPGPRLSRTPVRPAFAAPPAGWHTRELVEEAGMGQQFEELRSKGVLAERQPEGISPIGQLVPAAVTNR